MLRKHAARFGNQWDRYLPGVLWAYRNSPHDTTREKPSFLLFGIDCQSPTEAALLPPTTLRPTKVADYREELMLSLSSARELAAKNIQAAQKRYKQLYDRHSHSKAHQIGAGEIPSGGEWAAAEAVPTMAWTLPGHWQGGSRYHHGESLLSREGADTGTPIPSVSLSAKVASRVLLVWRDQQESGKGPKVGGSTPRKAILQSGWGEWRCR